MNHNIKNKYYLLFVAMNGWKFISKNILSTIIANNQRIMNSLFFGVIGSKKVNRHNPIVKMDVRVIHGPTAS